MENRGRNIKESLDQVNDLVSVIVPVYNAEKTVGKCIKSVLEQSYTNLELILIDDGSTDESLTICDAIGLEDNRIHVIHQDNRGVSSARNQGLRVANGRYGIFVDSDDYIDAEMLRRLLHLLQVHQCDVVIGGVQVLKKKETAKKRIPNGRGVYENSVWNLIAKESEIYGYAWGKLFCLDIVREHGLRFNEQMCSQEDLDFWLEYYFHCKEFYLSEVAAYNFVLVSGKRMPAYNDYIRNQLKLLRYAGKRTRLTEDERQCVQQRICGYIYGKLYAAGNTGSLLQACEELIQIQGLRESMCGCDLHGESGRLIQWLFDGKWKKMQHYWKLRRFARRVLRGK